MTAFRKAQALAGQRYDRDELLSLVHEVTTQFRMPNSFERSKMRAVCRYLADALDRCNGSTLQQRWNDFEKGGWPKWTDALDAALCSVGVFSRSPKRGSARHGRKQRMTASELVENAGVPDRFQQAVILYLETYEGRVSDVYRTLRHKAIALAHFWRFIRDEHPNVKRCSEILPRHVRDYVPHAITRARAVQRGPGAGEEGRPTP